MYLLSRTERRGTSARISDVDEPLLGLRRLEADVRDDDFARVEPAGRDRETDLAAVHRHRHVGAHRGARDLTGGRVTPDGMSTATTGTPAALICSISADVSSRGAPFMPGAEQRVDR